MRDVEATCAFYTRVLGMRVEHFAGGRTALHFGEQKINLHAAGREFEPKALRPTPGAGDLCFLTATPLSEVLEHLAARGVPVVAGPARKEGAMGPLESVYVRDPDGNLIEIANALPPDA